MAVLSYVAVPWFTARPIAPAGTLQTEAGGAPIGGVPGPGVSALTPDSVADAQVNQLTKAIGIWTTNVRANDKDFISATNLALVYHARGRLTANLDDYQRALDAARLAERILPRDEAARAVEATVLAGLHDFGGALATARALYADDPGQVGALATIGDAQLELGMYRDATASYGRLGALANSPAVDARLARLAYLTGDPARGLTLARRALDGAVRGAATDGDASPGDLVFYHYQLAEMARLTGDGTLARAEYRAALELRPDDLGSLVGLARIDAYSGNTSAAVGGLRRAAAIAPQPDTLALLGDLAARQGDASEASRQYATVRAIRRLSDLAGSVYDRQLLQFELDHGGASDAVLAQARSALAARPDAYGHDTVAWALYRLGRFDDAAAEMTAALASGVRDARLLAHAGAIALARGQTAAGRDLLRSALSLGPALDPLQADEARALLARS